MKLHLTLIFLCMLTANILAASPIAIHVYNPWIDNSYRQDSISIYGNTEVSYYPGKKMENDGAGWFTYIFKTMPVYQNDGFQFASSIGTPTDANAKRVTFPTALITFHYLDSLFNGATEFWIIPDDSIKKFKIYIVPPAAKVIHLFNPWPDNSPLIVISGNNDARRMQVNTNICGWYTYYFNGFVDSLKQVSFTDYYKTSKYMSGGLNAGKPIDLSTIFSTHDTIYILPRPFPSGPPSISTTFPGRLGDCPTREFSAIVYDQKMDAKSFFAPDSKTGQKVVKGMVQSQLGTNGKPVLGANAHTGFGDSLESWFITKKVNTTDSNRTCIQLKFTKGYDGRWEFDSDLKGGFFPIDNFNPYKETYQGQDKRLHNFHFTMEMHLRFAYRKGTNQTFMFRGDDDVWIFVNNKLAIDLGNLHDASATDSAARVNSSDTLRLDKVAATLGLTDAGNYPMDIFYCERQPSGSNLFIKTSIDLRNSDELFTKETVIGKGKTEYSIRQYHKTEQTGCGTTIVNSTEEKGTVEFYLSGPQFLDSLKHLDAVKTYFGGIIIQSDSTFTLDSAQIKGLASGRYTITFISKIDSQRSGFVTFTVVPIPDHLDLMPDTVVLDVKKDAVVDSISMGIEKDSLQLYSVVRDTFGIYIEGGTNLTWKSLDEKVVTIVPSKTDKSKAMITKVDGGSTWIVVSQNGLKSDSVLIHAVARPVWPLIKSAVMSDSRGDLIANLLYITLSDTFKVGQTLTSVEITYKNKTYIVSGANCKIEGNRIAAPFTSLTEIDTKPSGSATIKMDVNGKVQSHTGPFADGVGPVLLSAEVLEKESGETDVLYLTFSEPVYPAKLIGANLLLIRNGDKDTVKLNIANVRETINDSMYSVVLISTVNPPLPGEKLRLVPASKGGNISDLKDNRPHDLNKPVIIKLRKGAAAVLKSWYKDTNADGVLDSLFVQFKRAIELSELDYFSIGWNQKVYKVESGPAPKDAKFLKVNDSTILIPIRGSVVDAEKMITSGVMDIIPAYKNISNVPSRTIPSVIDSAAPVIVNAKLMRGGYNDAGTKEMDTLQITFSETVQSTGNYPFLLKSGNSTAGYQFKVSPPSVKGLLYTFIVNEIDPSTASPVKGDSIWINEKGGVVGGGIQQANEKNHRALLDVVQPPPEWISKVGPNPLKLPGGQLTIIVQSKRNVDFSPYTAGIKIYDALNNIIENTSMNLDDKSFVYKWSGHNRNGRLVGAGTYLAVVTVSENGHKIWSQTRNLGVKR